MASQCLHEEKEKYELKSYQIYSKPNLLNIKIYFENLNIKLDKNIINYLKNILITI